MKTDELIAALAADRAIRRPALMRPLPLALQAGGVLSIALFFLDFGFRPDLAAAFTTWRFDTKLAMVVLAVVLAFGLCRALGRPVLEPHPARRLLPLAALAVAALAVEMASVPASTWSTRLVGSNSLICLTTIPMLAVAPLAALLLALRSAAPAQPALAGAAAGLLSATLAAAIYAFHCFDDSPFFVVTWYVLASLPIIAAGALAGPRLLRW